jgi:hypothetical protein
LLTDRERLHRSHDGNAFRMGLLASSAGHDASATVVVITSAVLFIVGAVMLIYRRGVFQAMSEVFRGRASYDLTSALKRSRLVRRPPLTTPGRAFRHRPVLNP